MRSSAARETASAYCHDCCAADCAVDRVARRLPNWLGRLTDFVRPLHRACRAAGSCLALHLGRAPAPPLAHDAVLVRAPAHRHASSAQDRLHQLVHCGPLDCAPCPDLCLGLGAFPASALYPGHRACVCHRWYCRRYPRPRWCRDVCRQRVQDHPCHGAHGHDHGHRCRVPLLFLHQYIGHRRSHVL